MEILPFVAICGISLVCLGSLAFGAYMFIRAFGARIPVFFNMIGRNIEDDEDEVESVPRRIRPMAQRDLQVKAQDLDFDAAVDRYRRKFDQTNVDPKAAPFNSPSSTTLSNHVEQAPSVGKPDFPRDPRDRRWGRVDSNEHDDELLGGLWGDEDYDDEGGLF